MVRLLSIGIECLSSIIFILPAMVILRYTLWKPYGFGKRFMVFLFAIYAIAVFSAVGMPTAYDLQVNFNFHLIPLIDIFHGSMEYVRNTILNVLLFMPMGFLLPVIWQEYHSAKKTVWMGLAVSTIIELSQIFTFRLTDIDDLLTNTLGTFLGYYCGKKIMFKLPVVSINTKDASIKHEAVLVLGAVFLIAFFLKPLVSNAVWDLVLSGPLWESVK